MTSRGVGLTLLFLLPVLAADAVPLSDADGFSLAGRSYRFIAEDDPAFADVDHPDTDWSPVAVPGSLDAQRIERPEGCGWYRMRFRLPRDFPATSPKSLSLGVVWGAEESFLNGERLGATGTIRDEQGWRRMVVPYLATSLHPIPDGLLRYDAENLLAIRLCNGVDVAGLVHGPVEIGDAHRLAEAKRSRDAVYLQLDAAFGASAVVVIVVWAAFASQLRGSRGMIQLGLALLLGLYVILAGSLLFYESGWLTTPVYTLIVLVQFAAPIMTLYACWRLFDLGPNWPFLVALTVAVVGTYVSRTTSDRAFALGMMQFLFVVSWALFAMVAYRVLQARSRAQPESATALGAIVLIALSGAWTTWSSFDPSPPDWTSRYSTLIGYWIVPLFLLFAASRRVVRIQRRNKQLSADLLSTVENERRRISRELHDGVGQTMQAVKMRLDLYDRSRGGDDRIGTEDLARGISELRAVAQDIRPVALDAGDLTDQISDYAEGFAARAGLRLELDLDDAPTRTLLDQTTSEHVFRVVQEALGNVSRHADATTVAVRVSHEGSFLRIEVRDDGVGLGERPRRRRGIGLETMRERADLIGARLEIANAERGVRILLDVPVEVS